MLSKVIKLRFLKFSLIYATEDTFVYRNCLRLYEKSTGLVHKIHA